jgi:glycosyltransferase involved in cell wall biosynthesis
VKTGVGQVLVASLNRDRARARADVERLLRAGQPPGLATAARWHRIAGSLLDALDGDPRYEATTRELRPAYDDALRRELQVLADLRLVRDALDAAGVRWLVVKGPVISDRYYEAPGLRAYTDLDLVVPASSFAQAVSALGAAGCADVTRNWAAMHRLRAGEVQLCARHGTALDVHWALQFRGDVRDQFAVDVDGAISRARRVPVAETEVETFDPVDTLLHICLHAAMEGGQRLVWVNDIHQCVLTETVEWDVVVSRARAWRTNVATGIMLARARRCLGTPVPAGVTRELLGGGGAVVTALVDRTWPVHRASDRGSPARMIARSARGSMRQTGRELTQRLAALRGRNLVELVRPATKRPRSAQLYEQTRSTTKDEYLAAVGSWSSEQARSREPHTSTAARTLVVVSAAQIVGGAELSLLALATRLPAHGWDVVLVCHGPLAVEAERRGVAIRSVDWMPIHLVSRRDEAGRKRYLPSAALRSLLATVVNAVRIARVARDSGGDAVLSNSLPSHLVVTLAGLLARRPSFWYLREIVDAGPGRWVLGAAARPTTGLLSISDAVTAAVPGRPATTIPEPIEVPELPEPRRRGPRPVVGYLGRLDPRKGVEDVCLAAGAVDAEFRLAGAPLLATAEYLALLDALAERAGEGRVRFVGPVTSPWDFLLGVDVLVVPSRREPWGRVAAEALAAGVPVIAAAAGGLPEIVRDGVDGLLYPPGDVDRLIELLRTTLSDDALRTRLSAAGRCAVRRFDPDLHTERVAATLTAAADDRRGR